MIRRAKMAFKIPDEYIPLRFRIAKAQNWKVFLGLALIYAVEVALLYPVLYSKKPEVGTWPKILGASGDVLAFAVLLFSMAVDRYSDEHYVKAYSAQAKKDHLDWSEALIREHLLDYHAKLQMLTRNILTTEVGAALLAISTTATVIGDFV